MKFSYWWESIPHFFRRQIKKTLILLIVLALAAVFLPHWFSTKERGAKLFEQFANRVYTFKAGDKQDKVITQLYLLADARFIILHWAWDEECGDLDFQTANAGRWIYRADLKEPELNFYSRVVYDSAFLVRKTPELILAATDSLAQGLDAELYESIAYLLYIQDMRFVHWKTEVKVEQLEIEASRFSPNFFAFGCFKLRTQGQPKVDFTSPEAVAKLSEEDRAYALAYLLAKYRYEINQPDLLNSFYEIPNKNRVVFTGLDARVIYPMLTQEERVVFKYLRPD